uniref:Protein LIKE COV 3 n=1 Tax=Leersia perrieri TaxID=77586 RepID=A0A0D9XZC5_9ORYZ
MAGTERERDRELLLIPVAGELSGGDDGGEEEETSPPIGIVAVTGSPPPSAAMRGHHIIHHHRTGIEAFSRVIRSWAWKKFMTGCVILLPIAITFYATWWFIRFFDGFFSPIYNHLGINVFDQSSRAFKEVVIIRHPRVGEYALGFITSTLTLRGVADGNGGGGEGRELACVYVPTNNLYLGDIFLMSRADVIVPDLSVREAIEIVLSGGMSVPLIISAVEGVVGLGGGHGRPVKNP